jgi:hypothetical protein
MDHWHITGLDIVWITECYRKICAVFKLNVNGIIYLIL